MQSHIEELYFEQSTLQVDGKRILDDAAFMTQYVEDKDGGYKGSCVKTKNPYEAKYKHARIKIDGPRSVSYYH